MENTLEKKYKFSGIFWFFAAFSLIKFYDFAAFNQEVRNLIIAVGFALLAYANARYSHQFDQQQKSTGYYLSILGAGLGITGILMRFI